MSHRRNVEYGPSVFDRLAMGSEARDASVTHGRLAYGDRVTISLEGESRRRFHLPRVALPLLSVLAVTAGLLGAEKPNLNNLLDTVKPKVAQADGNEPAVVQDSNGKTRVVAPLYKPGRGDDFYGPQGMELCGVHFDGSTVATVVALDENMGIEVVGDPEMYADPFGLQKPYDYDSLARAADRESKRKMEEVGAKRRVAVLLVHTLEGEQECKRVSIYPEPVAEVPVVTPPVAPEQPPVIPNGACVGISESIAVPGSHGAVPVANLDANTAQRTWIRPIYDPRRADAAHNWEGIGPWAPIAFASEPNAAHLKTFGNVGEFVVVGDVGGSVELFFMQQAQHWTEALRRPDGKLDTAWQLQYTIDGLPAGAPVTPFDPDTGKQLTWPDGTPIQWAAGPLGTFSMGFPRGVEVRVGLRLCIPGQQPGVQNPEVKVRRGPNDRPGLTGENQLPNTAQVVKPGMPD